MATENQLQRSQSAEVIIARPAISNWRKRRKTVTNFLRTKPLGTVGLALVLFFAVLAVFSELISPYDPRALDSSAILEGSSAKHWFGTDFAGRDVLSRVIFGARISIFVGMVSMIAAAVGGAALGVSTGYFGGKYDLIVQRFVDALTAFPSLVLALALVSIFSASLTNVIIAITIVFVPRVTRIVRAVTLSIKEMPYVDSAKAIGSNDIRIMVRHILPNTIGSLLVVTTGLVGSAILIEASLSFLGVGMPIGVITWGAQLSGQVLQYFTVAPHIAIYPGVALTLAVFGINVFGDALRDALDPRLRGR